MITVKPNTMNMPNLGSWVETHAAEGKHLGGLTSVQIKEDCEERYRVGGGSRGGTTAPLLPYTRTREHAQSGGRRK